MKEQLRAYLMADAGIAALVGPRVTWVVRERKGEFPAIVLHQISGRRNYAMTAPSGVVEARVQVDCWARSNKDATATGRAVNHALGGLRAELDGVEIQGAFLELEQDLSEPGSPPNEQIHRVSMDFIVWHTE
ncbi:MAG TPA: DUF3168 domain-containing protein [Xanthobacteraceae bacterium]|nr:DUF3168 domain-containing protein [Xanthobacteraceae bacterium]